MDKPAKQSRPCAGDVGSTAVFHLCDTCGNRVRAGDFELHSRRLHSGQASFDPRNSKRWSDTVRLAKPSQPKKTKRKADPTASRGPSAMERARVVDVATRPPPDPSEAGVHEPNRRREPDGHAPTAERMSRTTCSCTGANENCPRCFGRGYVDTELSPRANRLPQASPLLPVDVPNPPRPTKRKEKNKKKNREPVRSARGRATCPHCSATVNQKNLRHHVAKVHGGVLVLHGQCRTMRECPVCHLKIRADRISTHLARHSAATRVALPARKASGELVSCPDCAASVRKDRLAKHRKKVHVTTSGAARTSVGRRRKKQERKVRGQRGETSRSKTARLPEPGPGSGTIRCRTCQTLMTVRAYRIHDCDEGGDALDVAVSGGAFESNRRRH